MKRFLVAILIFWGIQIQAQFDRPLKLVVFVVVDQMRYDYVDRFWEQYTDKGFKTLVGQGFNYRNTHYNYAPTRTAPGHASLLTGTTPSRHGITSNNWFDKEERIAISPIADSATIGIGTLEKRPSVSPKKLLASTVNDELKLALGAKAKVIGLGLKDRAAVLTAGHMADAAYWFSGSKVVSSSYYMRTLPEWVVSFNAAARGWQYMKGGWDLLLPSENYPKIRQDDRSFEKGIVAGRNQFPYDFKKSDLEHIAATPFGNSLLTDLAITCIESEGLGQTDRTDFLTIGYSATDYIGHRYGAGSLEIMDTYLRLDRDLGRLLAVLDNKVGRKNYVLVLTADHAGMHNAGYLQTEKYHAGFTYKKQLSKGLDTHLESIFGISDLVLRLRDEQVYLDFKKAAQHGVKKNELVGHVKKWLVQFPGIRAVYTKTELLEGSFRAGSVRDMLQRGIHPKRTGDIFFLHEPGWQSQYLVANHGTPYTQDTHVPHIWFGGPVSAGQSVAKKSITDIAPTLSFMLRVPLPNAADGQPLIELFE
ncbi:alkaline phosphatase family protein [Sediminicola luteus]|uniref:Alkaline phosphatase n=1 Tax=Sediminicola luteus TaxID=319238 RepID=A0A2A4GDF3_9FLAO|nr:alkaline phosphatase family protein [Sediminicola luteus]PCE65782.1 hypothetical protein B7P33_00300 [Sediminicola luteus]